MTQLEVVPSLPNITGPRSMVHSLAIYKDILACSHCLTVLTKVKNIREHYLCHHSDVMPAPQQWQACKTQRMKLKGTGSQCMFWEMVVMMPNMAIQSDSASTNAMIAKLM